MANRHGGEITENQEQTLNQRIQNIRENIFDFLGVENVDISAGNMQISTMNDTLSLRVNPDTGEPVRIAPMNTFQSIPPIYLIGGGALILLLLLKK